MKFLQVLEEVVLRGIQGQIEDNYLLQIAQGPGKDWDSKIGGFAEAKYMAEQVYASWHKGWTR